MGHHSPPPRRSARQRALRAPARPRQRGPRRARDGGRLVPALAASPSRGSRAARACTSSATGGSASSIPSGRAPIAVPWGLLVDRLSGTLLLIVTGVGFLIHLYSVGLHVPRGRRRLRALLHLPEPLRRRDAHAGPRRQPGPHLRGLGRAWGSASYLLIGFWYTDEEKAYAGRKAFVTNRIGDFGFLLGLFAIYSIFGTADFGQLVRQGAGASARTGCSPPASSPAGRCRAPSPSPPSASSWAPPARARRSRSTSGCPTPWPARRRSRPSSTPPPW